MKKILGMLFLACIMAFFGCKKDDSVSLENLTPIDKNGCFCFEAVDDGAVVSMVKYSKDDGCKVPNVSLEYSLDMSNWSPFVVGETYVSLENVGNRVYIRAKYNNDIFCNAEETTEWAWNSFSSSKRVKVGGNIMYLLDGTGKKTEFDTLSNKNVFRNLFKGMDKLTDASKLALPATTLAEGCYYSMFSRCISLTVAPELPATTLAEYCYNNMFELCESLTAAPELPATTLLKRCYGYMFYACVSLQNIEVNFTDWGDWNTCENWITDEPETGTFICPEGLDVSRRDCSHIPEGWTIVTK